MIRKIQEKLAKYRKTEAARVRRFGNVKPIISAEAHGRRIVAIGNTVMEGDWRTFPDFLKDYLWHVIGKEWFESEIRKAHGDQHHIMQMWVAHATYSKSQTPNEMGLIEGIANGNTKAFYQIAYDLYILRHHQKLHDLVLRRLLNANEFQGARYELFATATMIRAGFSIEHEDETDGSKRHVEFIATEKETGIQLAVEAKSRHRAGVLGMPGEPQELEDLKLKMGQLANDAIGKGHHLPLVVFLDLNVPPAKIEDLRQDKHLSEIVKTLDQIKKTDEDKDFFNLILYTNHPYHYTNIEEPYAGNHWAAARSDNPLFVLDDNRLIDSIMMAVDQFGNIPNEFLESWDGTIE